MVTKETDKGADKTQEASGTLRHCVHVGEAAPCSPQVSGASAVPQTMARSGRGSDPRMASKDLAALPGAAGDGLHP